VKLKRRKERGEKEKKERGKSEDGGREANEARKVEEAWGGRSNAPLQNGSS